MNLFMAAGLDIPASRSSGPRVSAPLPRVPLFTEKAIEKAFLLKVVEPTDEQIALAATYAQRARGPRFGKQKKTAVRPLFFDEILTGLLGYTRFSEEGEYSLAFEHMLRRKPVDVALGRFFPDQSAGEVFAPFEMKGPDTADLDKIMAGRGISPVQQAWDYAADAPGAKWVLVSNCLEIRLYRFGRGREAQERFDLTRIDKPEELKRLLLILGAGRFLGGETEALLFASDETLKDITDELYVDVRRLRGQLVGFLEDSADGPQLPLRTAIETAQTLLDRVIFVAFACGNGMLPKDIFRRAVKQQDEFDPKPVWQNVRRLFRWIDEGHSSSRPHLDIWPYNGGLFAEDPVADSVTLPDALAGELATLVDWDFGKEVSVNVLGHIFEQSIGDIETLREGVAARVSQRKRQGVVYTPDHITRFLVEQTIAQTLRERFGELLVRHAGVGVLPAGDAPVWTSDGAERQFWLDYLGSLRDLTIVDPACGSGAFLVAAFDLLVAEYHRVTERLADLGAEQGFDVFDEILSKNLHGVDLNTESVEITRLSLWLKTARRKHRLASLDETIRDGDSLIDDAKASGQAFDWKARFPQVFARGGFDIVIGNPPYVRMEHLKAFKPWLSAHYAVADERTDLSAYFFEKGLDILKSGGRLGYISTSTFFRAGYGEKLRLFLGERAELETVVDFGDAQIFEGVTTYPAIVTAVKKAMIGLSGGNLHFLKIAGEAPVDLGRAFAAGAVAMPRSRLTGGSWQFEDDALSRLRDKIVKGRRTLGEVYGAPLYRIKTGLNEAFVIDTETRDRLVAAEPESAEILKPFLKGENIRRWRVEPEGLWLINTPKGKVRIDDYPAVREWLLPFKDRLEARATQQEWWELQQAQLAYQPKFAIRKISFPHFQNEQMFTLEVSGAFSNDKSYFIANGDLALLAFLNSRVAWSFLTSISPSVRNGWHEMRVQYVEMLPVLDLSEGALSLAAFAEAATVASSAQRLNQNAFHHRLLTDLAAPGTKLSRKLERFHELDFAAFRGEVKRALKAEIPVKERADWEALHGSVSAEIKRLAAEIDTAEREIDTLVYEAFDLTPEEIALLETSLDK